MPTSVQAPPRVEDHFALAQAHEKAGNLHEAAAAWIAGVQEDPTQTFAFLRLSDTLSQLCLHDASMIACRQALLVNPNLAEAYDRLGTTSELLGDGPQAIEHFTRSLAIKPDSTQISRHLASLLRSEGQLGAARDVLATLVHKRPDSAGDRFLLAAVLTDMGASDDAIGQLRKALSSRPRFPEALNNLALLLRAEGKLDQAEQHYRKALAQKKDYAVAWNNLANLQAEKSLVVEACGSYDKAISNNPDYAEARTNRALLWLLQGRFEDGWNEYEWRWNQSGLRPRELPQPPWDGSSLAGKTILLHAEQGAGDTIQFVRYARTLHGQGATVLLHCQEPLVKLLSGMPELAKVVSGSNPVPPFDVHAPLMSLPRLCGTTEATIPSTGPYVLPRPGTPVPASLSREKLFRVGLVWAGNRSHRNDRNRSIAAELLQPLIEVEGAKFFSFQIGTGSPWPEVADLTPDLTDYNATAACLMELDLLVTVDTSIAHLAGAMNRPVWVLLPTCNDWRWLEGRNDSPWYPGMRLFRQTKLGDWRAVLDDVAKELRILTQNFFGHKDQEEGM